MDILAIVTPIKDNGLSLSDHLKNWERQVIGIVKGLGGEEGVNEDGMLDDKPDLLKIDKWFRDMETKAGDAEFMKKRANNQKRIPGFRELVLEKKPDGVLKRVVHLVKHYQGKSTQKKEEKDK